MKINDGARYDTENATLVASFSTGYHEGKFRYYEEDLYITERGAWFIVGAGHAMTGYAISYGDGRGWGEKICPLTPAEAMAWLEEAGELDAIEAYSPEEVVEPDVRAAAVVSPGPCRLQGLLPSTSRHPLRQDPWIGLAMGTHPLPACSMNGAARVVPSLQRPWSESMMGTVRGTNRKNRERRPTAHQRPTRDRRNHADVA